MVGKTLTEKMIRSGANLVGMLDKTGYPPDAALWLYSPESGEWKLVIAEAGLRREGPRAIYEVIQETISAARTELEELSLDSVSLTSPDAPIIALLSRAIKTGPGIAGIRFTNNAIDGTVIEDAYIYRLTPSVRGAAPRARSAR